MTVVSALLLGAPFAVHYALHRVRARVHTFTFEETQSGVKAIRITVQDDRVVDMGFLYENDAADRVVVGKGEE